MVKLLFVQECNAKSKKIFPALACLNYDEWYSKAGN